jgi:phosphate transport system substrate-binding protein
MKTTKYLGLPIITIFVAASLLLSSCGNGQTAPQTISVSGAFALYPLMTQWASEYQNLHPDIRIDVSAGGAGKGVSDTLSGAVDIGMVSRELTSEETDKGAFPIAVARDAVFGTINAQNLYYAKLSARGITREQLEGIYINGETTTWGQLTGNSADNESIHIYTRSDSAGAAEMWAKYLGDKTQEDLLGIGVNSDPGMSDAVAKDILGIGYNNLGYLYDPTTGQPVSGLAPLPLDINGNGQIDPQEQFPDRQTALAAVASGDYPSPPARDLYVITLHQPDGAVLDFLTWILNDGQAYVADAGYVQLSTDKLDQMRATLAGN